MNTREGGGAADRPRPASPDFTETPIDSREAWRGHFLTVHEDRVRLPDGAETKREYVQHPGAVIIVPMLDADTFVMERQYRYPLHRHFIEFPAGKIDAGEPPLDTARRELKEETGYVAASWQRLATLHPCIGYSDERIELYVARDLQQQGSQLDAGEFLEVLTLTRADILDHIRTGAITDTKTVVAMLWLEQFGL